MASNSFIITHGEDKVMSLKFRFSATDDPLDLTGVQEITVSLPQPSNVFLTKLLSTAGVQIDPASPKLGRILVPLSAADSLSLNPAADQDIEVKILDSLGKTTNVRFPRALTVNKAITEA